MLPTIEADLTLLRTVDGGRTHPICCVAKPERRGYSPHIVIGDPTTRKSHTDEDYLGVELIGGPAQLVPGDTAVVTMRLMYHPTVDYSAVVAEATFTLREGGGIVGFGRVLKRWG